MSLLKDRIQSPQGSLLCNFLSLPLLSPLLDLPLGFPGMRNPLPAYLLFGLLTLCQVTWGIVYPIDALSLNFGNAADRLPAASGLLDTEVEFVQKDGVYEVSADGESGQPLNLSNLPPGARFSDSALNQILNRVVTQLNEADYFGVYVVTDQEQIDPRTGRDRREPGDTSLTLDVYVGEIQDIQSVGKGGRIGEQRPIDHPYHSRILQNSPLKPLALGEEPYLFRKEKLDDYLRRLNRHPGRRVDATIASSGEPGKIDLHYLVSENRPYFAYGQIANTGTESVGEWQYRAGVGHYQLTGVDDVFTFDYEASDPSSSFSMLTGYNFPLVFPDYLKLGLFASYSEFQGEQFGVGTVLDFSGQSSMYGLEFRFSPWTVLGFAHTYFLGVRSDTIEVTQQIFLDVDTQNSVSSTLGEDQLDYMYGGVEFTRYGNFINTRFALTNMKAAVDTLIAEYSGTPGVLETQGEIGAGMESYPLFGEVARILESRSQQFSNRVTQGLSEAAPVEIRDFDNVYLAPEGIRDTFSYEVRAELYREVLVEFSTAFGNPEPQLGQLEATLEEPIDLLEELSDDINDYGGGLGNRFRKGTSQVLSFFAREKFSDFGDRYATVAVSEIKSRLGFPIVRERETDPLTVEEINRLREKLYAFQEDSKSDAIERMSEPIRNRLSTLSKSLDQLSEMTRIYVTEAGNPRRATFSFGSEPPFDESTVIPGLTIKRTMIVEGAIHLEDLGPESPYTEKIYPLNLDLNKFSPLASTESVLNIRAEGEKGAQFELAATLETEPLLLDGSLALTNVGIHHFSPYFNPYLNFELEETHFDLNTGFRIELSASAPRVSLKSGNLVLRDSSLRTLGEEERFVFIPQFNMEGIEVDLFQRRFAASRVRFRGGNMLIVVEEGGRVNLMDLLKVDSGSKDMGSSGKSSENRKWVYSVDSLEVERFEVLAEDPLAFKPARFELMVESFQMEELKTSKWFMRSFQRDGRLWKNFRSMRFPLALSRCGSKRNRWAWRDFREPTFA